MNKRIHKAFSLAEILVGLLIIGIISSAAMPLMTKMAQEKTGTDRNTIRCINESPANWYKELDGTTELPTEGTMCWAAVTDTQHDRGRALETAKWYINNGTADQEIMGKKILRTACDRGGKTACDYFIDSCWKSGRDIPPYCDDEANFLDLTYYLHQKTDASPGAIYIRDRLEDLLGKKITNLVNEVNYACYNDQKPHHEQNLKNNIACELLGMNIAWWIQQCNAGNADACKHCYDNNYNRSCTGVKTAWSEAPTGYYELTADGDPESKPTVRVSCNMTNFASAAITGCNAEVLEDCTEGYGNDYNKSCTQVKTEWSRAETEYYELTYKGPGNTERVHCNMTSKASAAITGCGYDRSNPIPSASYVPGDCEQGHNNNYNRTCDEIFASWSNALNGYYYNLTGAGDSPPDLVSSVCSSDSSDPGGPQGPQPPDPENTCGNQKGATTTFKAADTGLGYDFVVTNCNQADHDHLVGNKQNPCAGSTCSHGEPGCWYGKGWTLACHPEPYTTHPSGGCGTYIAGRGYDKYLCNYAGAEAACHALNGTNPEQYGDGCDTGKCTENSTGWRLPTTDEIESWRTTPGSNSPLTAEALALELCDHSRNYSPYCHSSPNRGCYGSAAPGYDKCYPNSLWARSDMILYNGYVYRLGNGSLRGPFGQGMSKPLSVRCARSL